MYKRGLGQLYKQTSDGTVVDCDLPENIFYSVCWNPFAPEAPSSAVPSNNPVPTPVPPPAPVATPANLNPLTTPAASVEDANATINATLAQGMLNNQSALNQYIGGMQAQGAAANAQGNVWMWVMVGVAGIVGISVLPELVRAFGGRR